MDFLDPDKVRRHTKMLYLGYTLIAIALALATTILVYAVYGFSLDRSGQVVQNGLVFFSSTPRGATVSLNGKLYKDKTNTRVTLPAGAYVVEIAREGYTPWRRSVTVEGGSVDRFDYPFLFPARLAFQDKQKFEGSVSFVSQSPDRAWLLVGKPDAFQQFSLFDLTSPDNPATSVSISEDLLTPGEQHRWEQVEWASNNRHLLLRHTYKGGSEYVLFDRQDPERTINLSKTLKLTVQTISLRDQKFDQYYAYDPAAKTLSTMSLEDVKPVKVLDDVLSFKTYRAEQILYTTPAAETGRVAIKMSDGERSYQLRTVAAGSSYLLDVARYKNDWFVMAGAQQENRVYVYKNPLQALSDKPNDPLVPVHVLKARAPQHVSFSANARFMASQNGQEFYVYDAENDKSYLYQSQLPIDTLQAKAMWMDGYRLTYVSGGKVVVFDFDSINQRTLGSADARFATFFDDEYRYAYNLRTDTVDAKAQSVLQRTALRTVEDL